MLFTFDVAGDLTAYHCYTGRAWKSLQRPVGGWQPAVFGLIQDLMDKKRVTFPFPWGNYDGDVNVIRKKW